MTRLITGLVLVSLPVGAFALAALLIWIGAVIAQALQARATVRRRLKAVRVQRSADIVQLYGSAHASSNRTAPSGRHWEKRA
jgi:hypothetical protein